MTDLEKTIRRVKIIQMLGDAGVCGEYQGTVNDCSEHAIDCPKTCTYAKKMEKEYENRM